MAELNHNFIKGRMNLDLDERLVADGEYRKAMNIEVSTSEGSNVGTVQSVLGNGMQQPNLAPTGGQVVGFIKNGKTNKGYYFVQGEKSNSMQKDMIVEHSASSGSTPVLVDVYDVSLPTTNVMTDGSVAGNDTLIIPLAQGSSIRPGMYLTGVFTKMIFGSTITINLTPTSGTQTVNSTGVVTNIGTQKVYTVSIVGPNYHVNIRAEDGTSPLNVQYYWMATNPGVILFQAKRALNFHKNNFITGINIVDDLLFWTDNISEPKKINITRSKEGTPSLDIHSKFLVYNDNNVIQSGKTMEEEHITVIKKSPLTPPSLEMYNNISGRGRVYGKTAHVNFLKSTVVDPDATPLTYRFSNLPSGSTVDVPFFSTLPDFEVGDVLIMTTDPGILINKQMFVEAEVRVVVTAINLSPTVTSGYNAILTVKVLSIIKNFQAGSVSLNAAGEALDTVSTQRWGICLEQSKSLFEFKFPRFAYRYKYQDGEYSSFSPFSEIAFIPSSFKYDTKEAYNLGMVNQLRFLKIKDFVPDGIPKGVIEVDILYKESNSPNIYTVKTVKSTDPEWFDSSTTYLAPWTGSTKGVISLESEVIYAAVAANQLLRPWDNVPRKALAQELSGNRIIYGNYLEGYNLNNSVNIKTHVQPLDLSSDLVSSIGGFSFSDIISSIKSAVGVGTDGAASIKSLRTYQMGIVYKDEYGRETPIFTNSKASFSLGKELASDTNRLHVQNLSNAPTWAHSFKFFIKETSNEYYNLALDRWYNAEDGSYWLAFPSAERNKINEDTYLHLKKQHDNDVFVKNEARYKVIAIENEAPDFVKMERTSITTALVDTVPGAAAGQFTLTSANSPPWLAKDYDIGQGGLVVRLFDTNATTDWFRVSNIDKIGNSIKIKGTFDAGDPSALLTATNVYCEIAREVFHNRPVFQGRFFVKVKADAYLIGAIAGNADITDDFTVTESQRHYHLKSSGKDNSWCQEYQWTGGSSSWTTMVGEGFYIDDVNRNWGTVPQGGTFSSDYGKGLSEGGPGADGNGNRSGSLFNHIEISLSRILDSVEEGFSISSHGKAQRDFYSGLSTTGTWLRWKEDPNGIVYEIEKAVKKGDSAYTDAHGSGIYNYDAGKGKERTWKSNKTLRIYITLKATGWVSPGMTGYKMIDDIKDKAPTWHSADLHNNVDQTVHPDWVDQYGATTTTNSWSPTKNDFTTPGTQADIKQASQNYDVSGGSCQAVGVTPDHYNTIEFVRRYNPDLIKEMSDNPAVFETEPKEDIGLDIYYETDQAFPTKLEADTNEIFAKAGSEVRIEAGMGCSNLYPYYDNEVDCVANGHEWRKAAVLETWKLLDQSPPVTCDINDAVGSFLAPNDPSVIELSVTLTNSAGVFPVKPGDKVVGLIPAYFPVGTEVSSVITSINPLVNTKIKLTRNATSSGLAVPVDFLSVRIPRIVKWSDNEMTLDTKPIGTLIDGPGEFKADNLLFTHAVFAHKNREHLTINKQTGTSITCNILQKNPLAGGFQDSIYLDAQGRLNLVINKDVSKSKIALNWSNCFSFGNGVESDRIRDDYNTVRIDKGVKASTTLDIKYQEERKKNSLIYSGIYNNASGVNNTNQFIMAEKITKDLNPRHGSIQKLHAREGDLITLCEDKVFKILANKDALYNADGNPQMIATNRVLGQATPMGGEYGISKNPESFASQAYKAYFSDKSRGVILKLDSQGLIPISDHGMKDYFSDNLINADNVIGSYDDKKDSYNITLTGVGETISYGEKTNGWTSFKSFLQEGGFSLNNNYYTFKDGNIYRHHQGNTAVFYGVRTDPYVDVLFNQLPSAVKSFGSLKYEGSQAKVTENLIDKEYNNNLTQYGWYVSEGNTNLQQTDQLEFKNKEGKWFSRIKGEAYDATNIDLTEFSFQGIDMAESIVEIINSGCMDPAAANYDPDVDVDCSGITTTTPSLAAMAVPDGGAYNSCDPLTLVVSPYSADGMFANLLEMHSYIEQNLPNVDTTTLKFCVDGTAYSGQCECNNGLGKLSFGISWGWTWQFQAGNNVFSGITPGVMYNLTTQANGATKFTNYTDYIAHMQQWSANITFGMNTSQIGAELVLAAGDSLAIAVGHGGIACSCSGDAGPDGDGGLTCYQCDGSALSTSTTNYINAGDGFACPQGWTTNMPGCGDADGDGDTDTSCCCYIYGCMDDTIGYNPMTPDPITGIGYDRFQALCSYPCTDVDGNPTGFLADNFDYKYDCDDGSCTYPSVAYGCTDPLAVNYDAGANFDDGSCAYSGCTDPLANNYNPSVSQDDGSCVYSMPCSTGTVAASSAMGAGMYPNIIYPMPTPYDHFFSNNNHAIAVGTQVNSLSIGCEITNQYLPSGTTVIDIIGGSSNSSYGAGVDVILSNAFINAPSPLGQTINYGPQFQQNYLDLDYECGNCNNHALTVSDVGDDDVTGVVTPTIVDPNAYTVTTHNLGDFATGSSVPGVAFLLITPNNGVTIKASDFSISGMSTTSSALPPTFGGGTLPPEVEFVKFEDKENRVYDNYINGVGTDPNVDYDPDWITTETNTIDVIVSLYPFTMPGSDLDILIDIDGSTNIIGSNISNITII